MSAELRRAFDALAENVDGDERSPLLGPDDGYCPVCFGVATWDDDGPKCLGGKNAEACSPEAVHDALVRAARARLSIFTPRRPDLSSVQPIRFAWERRIPVGALTLLVGEEGSGKGCLLAWMVARLTRGELPGDLFGAPVRVLLVGDEDGFADTWTPRLVAAGADLDYVRDLPPHDDLGLLDVHRDVEELRTLVRDEQFAVVIFDQLLDNLPAATDEFKPRSVRAALRPLGRLAREERFAAIGVLHTNKGGASFRQKMSGSHAFNALARSGLLLAQHPEDEDRRVLARGKGNLSQRPPAAGFAIRSETVQINGHTLSVPVACEFDEPDLSVDDLLTVPGDEGRLSEARQFLAAELAEGPRRTADLRRAAEDAGLAWRTVERAKSAIGARARRGAEGWVWEAKAANNSAMRTDGGLGGLGGDEAPDSANTANTANSVHGGLDGGLAAGDAFEPATPEQEALFERHTTNDTGRAPEEAA